MEDLRSKLQQTVALCDWSPLVPHAERDALFEVHDLELVDVGLAIAQDRARLVAHWLEAGLLARPSADRQELCSRLPGMAFETLIVQPFVLFRCVSN